jgi:exo-beta-1,3-glucanase (GH17 family)
MAAAATAPLREPCIAFSPYVGHYNPDSGPHPPPSLIDSLLNTLLSRTTARCIMTFGVLNGLDYTFEAARRRGIKVIAILYLDDDPAVNAASIAFGAALAIEYADTIVRLSCGSEVRTRLGRSTAEPIVRSCLAQLRAGGVMQPLTAIDTWWNWCNESSPCQRWSVASEVDWIGINIYPWWENKYSGLYPCTTAEQAADFHVARWNDVARTYPAKEIVVTEFGWPAAPEGYRETNVRTGQQCGVAGRANQRLVIDTTLARFRQQCLAGVVFSAFPEAWKTAEGVVGPHWGILPLDGSLPVPSRPLNLEVSLTGSTATFRWTAPLIGPVGAYRLEAGTASGESDVAVLPLPATTSSLTVPAVPAGRFFVRLRADNAAGTGGVSNEVTLIYPTTVAPPGSPQAMIALAFGNAVDLSWQPPVVGGLPDSYLIDVRTAPDTTHLVSLPVGAHPCFSHGAVPPGTYYLRVRASNAGGTSGPSNEVPLVVGTPPPGAPADLMAATGPGGAVTLTWSAPAAGGPPAGYVIDVGDAEGSSNLASIPVGPSTRFAATGVPPGLYYVRVRAVNGSGSSPPSDEVVVDTR